MSTNETINGPPLNQNVVVLPLVDECKLLRIMMSNDLNWNNYMNRVISKVNGCFFILYRAGQSTFHAQHCSHFTLDESVHRRDTPHSCGIQAWHEQRNTLERVKMCSSNNITPVPILNNITPVPIFKYSDCIRGAKWTHAGLEIFWWSLTSTRHCHAHKDAGLLVVTGEGTDT